jgi:flagellar biosynthesis chaperone FliJ
MVQQPQKKAVHASKLTMHKGKKLKMMRNLEKRKLMKMARQRWMHPSQFL